MSTERTPHPDYAAAIERFRSFPTEAGIDAPAAEAAGRKWVLNYAADASVLNLFERERSAGFANPHFYMLAQKEIESFGADAHMPPRHITALKVHWRPFADGACTAWKEVTEQAPDLAEAKS